MPENSFQIAYIGTSQFEDGNAYRCGALVVTPSGEPKEFRCTSPIRPNQLQRITYGKSLEPHLYTEVLGKPLVGALKEPISLYVVNHESLLNIRSIVSTPVVYARRQGKGTSRSSAGNKSSALIASPAGEFDPVVVQASESALEDTAAATPILNDAAKTIDILEPFTRLELAIEKVHDSKELDK